MAEYQLYCFAQSGNSYRAALMLSVIGADWQPIFVDFFKGETRTPEYRSTVNEMGEVPVLIYGAKKLSQSGVILTYLAERSGKFLPRGEDQRLEALRCLIIFDNQKLSGSLAPYRYLYSLAKPKGDPAVLAFLKGRADSALGILDKRLAGRPYLLGAEPSIADFSLVGYLYYPPEEFGFDIAAQHKNIAVWLAASKCCPAGRILMT